MKRFLNLRLAIVLSMPFLMLTQTYRVVQKDKEIERLKKGCNSTINRACVDLFKDVESLNKFNNEKWGETTNIKDYDVIVYPYKEGPQKIPVLCIDTLNNTNVYINLYDLTEF